MLDVLSNLLLAQAKECLLEKLLLPSEKLDLSAQLDIGQEAAQVRYGYLSFRVPEYGFVDFGLSWLV